MGRKDAFKYLNCEGSEQISHCHSRGKAIDRTRDVVRAAIRQGFLCTESPPDARTVKPVCSPREQTHSKSRYRTLHLLSYNSPPMICWLMTPQQARE